MRRTFADEVYKLMKKDDDIFVLTGDLGYGVWDMVKSEFPERYINTGAAEQSMMDIAVGLALSGKTPIVYSITPFLLWRPAETIRTYINHERIKVILVGSGRGEDYKHDGYSHNASDDMDLMKCFPNIDSRHPDSKQEVLKIVKSIKKIDKPMYINLRK